LPVKIRLSRTGGKKKAFYRVVVADARTPRDGRFIDLIGRYDPRKEPSLVEIDADKAKDWMAKGAQPTQPVVKLLEIAGVLPARPTKDKKPREKLSKKAAAKKAEAEATPKAAAPQAETAEAASEEAQLETATVEEAATEETAEVADEADEPSSDEAEETAEVAEPETEGGSEEKS
jgi:small subunit ribosomal protein S16